MRINSKGRVTIPIEIRKQAGLLPKTEVEFVLENGRVYLRKLQQGSRRGDKLVESLRGKGSVRMTTDQIMALTRGR